MSGALSHCRTVFGVEEKNIKKKKMLKNGHMFYWRKVRSFISIFHRMACFLERTQYIENGKKKKEVLQHIHRAVEKT